MGWKLEKVRFGRGMKLVQVVPQTGDVAGGTIWAEKCCEYQISVGKFQLKVGLNAPGGS